jgi:hypothetical protein
VRPIPCPLLPATQNGCCTQWFLRCNDAPGSKATFFIFCGRVSAFGSVGVRSPKAFTLQYSCFVLNTREASPFPYVAVLYAELPSQRTFMLQWAFMLQCAPASSRAVILFLDAVCAMLFSVHTSSLPGHRQFGCCMFTLQMEVFGLAYGATRRTPDPQSSDKCQHPHSASRPTIDWSTAGTWSSRILSLAPSRRPVCRWAKTPTCQHPILLPPVQRLWYRCEPPM